MVQDVFQLGQAIGVMIVLMQSAAAVLIRSRQVLREALWRKKSRREVAWASGRTQMSERGSMYRRKYLNVGEEEVLQFE